MGTEDIFQSIQTAFIQTSITEWIIFTSAIIYVLLATIENVWCWLFGILSSFLSIYLCYTAQLFLECGLQLFYVAIGVYGWYQWLYGSAEKKELKVVSWSLQQSILPTLIGLFSFLILGFIAGKYSSQALPYLDGFITAFSIIATWMTAKKILENWLFWIVIDALAIYLYASRGFYLIALIYLIYTFLAAAGYFSWRKRMNT